MGSELKHKTDPFADVGLVDPSCLERGLLMMTGGNLPTRGNMGHRVPGIIMTQYEREEEPEIDWGHNYL